LRKHPAPPAGAVHRVPLDSTLLRGNRPGDPTLRDVTVYTPPGYDPARRYPLFMDLVGYTGTGAAHTNWKPFGLNLPERLDRLLAAGKMGPVIAVLPDCFTSYGGNQYIDSSATGPYMAYLVEEVIPLVERTFAVAPGRAHRAVFGKSSGGYGAMVHGLLRPDVWGAIACHSGDAYWEYLFMGDFPNTLRCLMEHEGSVERFLEAIAGKEKLSTAESHALMSIGMAAHYDPDPAAPLGFHLPFDPATGRLVPERWERWLRHDPVRILETHADNLRALSGIWIDCGWKDQYHLLWGARMLHEGLITRSIPHVYEEFPDDHSDIDYRMDRSLPYLYRAVAPAS
jgi:enterochelin esterase-like enzyme